MISPWFRRLAYITTLLAFCVIVIGAFVRLTDAGLGCPDWPGCYGHITPPDEAHELSRVEQQFPGAKVEAHKAWNEMIHRYLAATLGLLIVVMALVAWRNRRSPAQPVLLPTLLVLLVSFQGALGMWTVTMLLRPAIVTMHLLMGMLTLALLGWLAFRARGPGYEAASSAPGRHLRGWAFLGLFVLFAQIALGGWTSTNYAALHCPDFPTCQGQWLPPTDFSEAFDIVGEPGVNYEGGLLDNDARVTIHVVHRIGALITTVYLLLLAMAVVRSSGAAARRAALLLMVVLALQVGLGIGNVVMSLPLGLAVAHNGGAALLLLALVFLNHALRRKTAGAI